jgi:hypothetical protein
MLIHYHDLLSRVQRTLSQCIFRYSMQDSQASVGYIRASCRGALRSPFNPSESLNDIRASLKIV